MSNPALPVSTRIRTGVFSLSETTVTYAACLAAFVILARYIPDPQLLKFSNIALQNVGNVLAPLILVALLIERAVEVVMTVWRAETAQLHEARLARAQQMAGTNAASDREVAAAEITLSRYKAQSRRIAFALTFTLGLFVAQLGIRAIQQFLAEGALTGLVAHQAATFRTVDMWITAAMIAGGADGIHRIVSAFTAFADATKKRATTVAP
ncbi:hypothetical protein [Longimicrobium sp.]|jgi:hypothetical protein|uniref:hypothetical protein n=1 Tax=Longimicrobium sp. TaxID=2029185 RepID=UPI002F91F00C